jgi:hypothetical protein
MTAWIKKERGLRMIYNMPMDKCIIQRERILGDAWRRPSIIAGIIGIRSHKKKEKLSYGIILPS